MKAMTYIVDRRGNRFPMFESDAERVAKWWDEMYPREAPHVVVLGEETRVDDATTRKETP